MAKKQSVNVYYRIVKAGRGHPFAGLYAVEKAFYEGERFIKKEIVHEWDMRIISEAILAKLGGGEAYESFKIENELEDEDVAKLEQHTQVIEPRTKEDLASLTARKLNNELKLKPTKE